MKQPFESLARYRHENRPARLSKRFPIFVSSGGRGLGARTRSGSGRRPTRQTIAEGGSTARIGTEPAMSYAPSRNASAATIASLCRSSRIASAGAS